MRNYAVNEEEQRNGTIVVGGYMTLFKDGYLGVYLFKCILVYMNINKNIYCIIFRKKKKEEKKRRKFQSKQAKSP